MTYSFHPEARLEYREAATFYEERRPGLGAAFTVEVEATIQKILEKELDSQDSPDETDQLRMPFHDNIRGENYYQ